MAIVKLRAGETVLVAATMPGLGPDQKPPVAEAPVDPGYGIDLGLGWLRPTHPIAPGGRPPATGGEHPSHPITRPDLKPTHPIVLPEPEVPPVDPAYGIDEDIGYVKPEHPIVLPGDPSTPAAAWEVKVAWTPTTGWVVVAIPTGAHPAPSKR